MGRPAHQPVSFPPIMDPSLYLDPQQTLLESVLGRDTSRIHVSQKSGQTYTGENTVKTRADEALAAEKDTFNSYKLILSPFGQSVGLNNEMFSNVQIER